MIAPDTSVVIAGLTPWHVAHEQAREALNGQSLALVGHVAVESVSALSRMPEPHRLAPETVLAALRAGFPQPWLTLGPAELETALATIVDIGIRGGALYDALVASTAASHGAHLVSSDRRAAVTYTALGIDFTLV